ncbi:MAG TPA: ABC transporter ATP-binding protein [Candidatus Nitrosopolaris sp.]|nr:ABC transporter ATP-binding protein [Candidatus Nitrosopolaris sp.]
MKMNEETVIRTRDLTRYFGARPAVYDLNLEVPRGCVFAYLGRNGSGKTTTIRLLLGLLEPTRGEGSLLGYDIRDLPPEVRARIGYLAEEHQLYGWMSVKQCGEFQSRFYPRWNEKIFRGVIGHFNLKPTARVKDLSRGERAGLCLGLTLAPEPELLVLDDPAMGLDPVAHRSLVESMIYLTRRSDRTIFFSSHQLADVERVADYLAVLDRGVLRVCCSLETFRNSVRQVRLRFPGAPPPVPKVPGLLQAFRTDDELRVICLHYADATERALRALSPAQMEPVPLNLEDAFISYLGERGEKSFILSETEAQP